MRNLNNCYLFHAISIMLISVFLVTGCEKENRQSEPTAQQSQPQIVIKQTVVQQQISSAKSAENLLPQFNFSTKKDPFKAFVDETSRSKAHTSILKEFTALPIQKYAVREFKISGIIAGLKENQALIIDPTGKGYVVKKGMLIGDSNGRITRIATGSIEVAERYKEDTGRTIKRTIKLTMPKKNQ